MPPNLAGIVYAILFARSWLSHLFSMRVWIMRGLFGTAFLLISTACFAADFDPPGDMGETPPGYGGPVYGGPVYGGPGYGAPVYGRPAYGAPVYGEPVYGGPVYRGPIYSGPAYGAPVYRGPVYGVMPPY